MIYMSGLPDGRRVGRSAIAEVTDVPEAYLAKILQHLVRARLIRSRPGVHGGFELSRAPASLSMLEVIEAVDGPAAMTLCLIDENACARSRWCNVKHVLLEAQTAMLRVLGGTMIAELAEGSVEQHMAAAEGPVLTSITAAVA